MDIRQKRSISTTEIIKFLPLIRFKDNHIDLLGSSSFQSQTYYSDYDLFSAIKGNYTPEEIFKELTQILTNTFNDPSIYFIE